MSLFDDAAHFAVDAHAGALRKGDGTPYILHPFEAAAIAASITTDEEVLAAALLHDTIEDTGTTPEQISSLFGPRVLTLVLSETEDKRPDLPPSESWRTRKEENLRNLERATDQGVSILWVADKLANIRSLVRLKEERGERVWDAFNERDPAQHAWYYHRVADLTRELAHTHAWQELNRLIALMFDEH